MKRHLLTEGGNQLTNFIPEGDIYRFAAKSELPGADEFESWIFDEVLPSIHKTGTYSLPGAKAKVPPLQPESAGGVAQLLKLIRATMKDNGQPPEVIAQTVKELCEQFGVRLPDNFVRRSPFCQLSIVGMFLTD